MTAATPEEIVHLAVTKVFGAGSDGSETWFGHQTTLLAEELVNQIKSYGERCRREALEEIFKNIVCSDATGNGAGGGGPY